MLFPDTSPAFRDPAQTPQAEARQALRQRGPFGYYFEDAAADERQDLAPALGDLAGAMLDPLLEAGGDDPAHDGILAPIYTYLGYMIEHDISAPLPLVACAEDGRPVLSLAGRGLVPLDRESLPGALGNARSGGLRLESLYGDGLAEASRRALRDPRDLARLRKQEGSLLGDARNGGHAVLLQVQQALVRLHNLVADSLSNEIVNPRRRFAEARRQVTWIWQWLVINDYLPHVCDPMWLDQSLSAQAGFYDAFRKRISWAEAVMPVPLEYSFAVAGFSHAMIRAAYDLSPTLGRPAGADARSGAPMAQMMKGPVPDMVMNRVVQGPGAHRDRAGRRIDPGLAAPLGALPSAHRDWPQSLPLRCLKVGYRLSLPTAQGAITTFNQHAACTHRRPLPLLGESDIASGLTGAAVAAGGFENRTPLWFYILKEAELSAMGLHLGPLGSTLLAETLSGLVIGDPDSYWHVKGLRPGCWQPERLDLGHRGIRSFEDLFALTGVANSPLANQGLAVNGRARAVTGA